MQVIKKFTLIYMRDNIWKIETTNLEKKTKTVEDF